MANCVCFRKRRLAREVSRKLRASLATSKLWRLHDGALTMGDIWRVYPSGAVTCRGCGIWLPLLQRLCMMSAARHRIAQEALRNL